MNSEDNPAIAAILKQFKGKIVGIRNTARATPRIPQTIETTIDPYQDSNQRNDTMLLEKTDRQTDFLVIKHRAICMESEVQQEGYEPVEVRNPRTDEVKTKWIRKFDGVEGYVSAIEWYDRKDTDGTRYLGWKLTITDGAARFFIDLPFNAGKGIAYSQFSLFAGNIDFTQKVSFHAWHDKQKDKTAFRAKQGEHWVANVWTKNNPGKLPQPEPDGMGGLDWKAQQRWLKEYMENTVIPKCNAAQKKRDEVVSFGAHPPVSSADDPFGDDFDAIPNGTAPPDNKWPELDSIPF